MSATDELRRLLDERRIIWQDKTNDGDRCEILPGDSVTWWFDHNDVLSTARENFGHKLAVRCECTPAQAVYVTLGRGNCKTIAMDCFGNPPFNRSGLNGNSTAVGCSECGAPWSTCGLFRGNALKHNFKACPICGREIEQ